MRIPLMAGNWKMYKTKEEAVALATELKGLVADAKDVEALVCPPFTNLDAVAGVLKGSTINLGGQNMCFEAEGARTGEISAGMLLSVGCRYVILGHSERRHIFGEPNDLINKKVKAALAAGLKAILCVGEKLEEREAGSTEKVVEAQLAGGLADVSADQMAGVVIAYEPVWAIGTGKTATPDMAGEVHRFIRGQLAKLYNDGVAGATRIQYGGSVKPENVKDLMAQEDIDGALVGGASLKADSFSKIVKFNE